MKGRDFMELNRFQAIAIKAKQDYLDQVEANRASSDYCEHGTYVGSWWGPDYLCGGCEEGYTITNQDAYKVGLYAARKALA